MCPFGRLLAVLTLLLLMAGCTSTQVKDGAEWAAGSLFIMALDVALDGPEGRLAERKRHEAVPGNEWSPCPPPCQFAQEVAADNRLAEVEARKRRIEAEEFRAEFDAFMKALEEVEQKDGNAPSAVLLPNE